MKQDKIIKTLKIFFGQEWYFGRTEIEREFEKLTNELRTCRSVQTYYGDFLEEDSVDRLNKYYNLVDILGDLLITLSEQYQIDYDFIDYCKRYLELTNEEIEYLVGEENYQMILEEN